MKQNPYVIFFTDGACSGNPGPGGWGVLGFNSDTLKITELGGGQKNTTNNQMELEAAIRSLQFIQAHKITSDVFIYLDSKYVMEGITKWVYGWEKREWKKSDGNSVANTEYWQRLRELTKNLKNKINWRYVPGHSGVVGNDRVDAIAVAFSQGTDVDLYEGVLGQSAFELSDFLPQELDTLIASLETGDPLGTKEKKKPSSKTKGGWYLSLVNGVLKKHTTWPECEAVVKGVPGAKYKKVATATEEAEMLKKWGVSLNSKT